MHARTMHAGKRREVEYPSLCGLNAFGLLISKVPKRKLMTEHARSDLVAVFIPALVTQLCQAEAREGLASAEEEVVALRDNSANVRMRDRHALEVGVERVTPRPIRRRMNDWQAIRLELLGMHEAKTPPWAAYGTPPDEPGSAW
jgi:hypothetical protein